MSSMFERLQELQNNISTLTKENDKLKEKVNIVNDNSQIVSLLKQILNSIDATNKLLSNVNVNSSPSIDKVKKKSNIVEDTFKPQINMDGMSIINSNDNTTVKTIVDDDIDNKLKVLENL